MTIAADQPDDSLAGRLALLTDAALVLGPGLLAIDSAPLLWEGDQA